MEPSRRPTLPSSLPAAVALVALVAFGWAHWRPAQAKERAPAEMRKPVAEAAGEGRLATSPRDPLRELRAQVVALQRRVSELEAQVARLEGAVPGEGLGARVGALEGVLAVAPGGDVTLSAPGKLSLQGGVVDIEAAAVQTQAGTATFSGVVNVQTLNAESVVAEEMSPAAGNVW